MFNQSAADCLGSMGIHIVDKVDNPTNLPQARPVERYWAEIDRRLGLFKHPAENLSELTRRLKKVVKDIPETMSKSLWEVFVQNCAVSVILVCIQLYESCIALSSICVVIILYSALLVTLVLKMGCY